LIALTIFATRSNVDQADGEEDVDPNGMDGEEL
jgi:hypothetical protein